MPVTAHGVHVRSFPRKFLWQEGLGDLALEAATLVSCPNMLIGLGKEEDHLKTVDHAGAETLWDIVGKFAHLWLMATFCNMLWQAQVLLPQLDISIDR